MIYSVKSKPFVFGFIGGVVIFAIAHVWKYLESHCHHCPITIGFPFPVHVKGIIGLGGASGEYNYEHLYPEALIANIILIFLSSLGIGLITELICRRSKIGTRGTGQQ
jgi:hypothetical protein